MQRKGKPRRTSRSPVDLPPARRSSWTRLICWMGIVALPLAGTLISARPSVAAWSKQVIYQTKDGHIHELSVTIDGTWQHTDLTQLTGAPPTGIRYWAEHDTSPVGYTWYVGASKQIVYWGEDVHIHELYVAPGQGWLHADLTLLTGAPIPLDERGHPQPRGRLSAYGWEAGKSKQVVYVTLDGHIHELSVQVGENWRHADLTQIAGAPRAACGFANGYAWETGRSKQVVYLTANGHIHEIAKYTTSVRGWELAARRSYPTFWGGSGPNPPGRQSLVRRAVYGSCMGGRPVETSSLPIYRRI
jgi:hypothetical protein